MKFIWEIKYMPLSYPGFLNSKQSTHIKGADLKGQPL